MTTTRIAVLTSVPELSFWFDRWAQNPLPDVDLIQIIGNRGFIRSDALPARMLKQEDFSSREEFEHAMLDELMPRRVDYVIAWEFDTLLSKNFMDVFSHKLLNIHPSLLPQYKGLPEKAYVDILHEKPLESGATLHEIDAGIDTGKVIAQKKFPLEADESLFSLKEKNRKAGMELIIDYFLPQQNAKK